MHIAVRESLQFWHQMNLQGLASPICFKKGKGGGGAGRTKNGQDFGSRSRVLDQKGLQPLAVCQGLDSPLKEQVKG